MGMSTHVVGFKDTAEHEKHVKVWEFCKQQGVSLPKETSEYFGWRYNIDPKQMSDDEIEEILQVELDSNCLEEWGNDYATGYELDVSKIPEGVTRIRFWNSW